MNRMPGLQVSPRFRQLALTDPPNHDAAELDALLGFLISYAPRVSDHNFLSFSDNVFDGDVNIREIA